VRGGSGLLIWPLKEIHFQFFRSTSTAKTKQNSFGCDSPPPLVLVAVKRETTSLA